MKTTTAILIGLIVITSILATLGRARAEQPIAAADNSETPQQRDRRMAWWRESRFGLFIHFGIFSLPTEEPRRMNKYFKLPDACHRQGLKMCWYYSIMDWHHRDYAIPSPHSPSAFDSSGGNK